MTSTREAGDLIALDRIHLPRRTGVNGLFLKASRTFMAVQALAIIVRLVQLYRVGYRTDVLIINVSQSTHFRSVIAIEGVLRMACKTCFLFRHAMVLEVYSRDIFFIVDIQT